MESKESALHEHQLKILKKLVLSPTARFNDLLIEEIGSEHMNYHLKRLMDVGFVTKEENRYTLTDSGKNFSNLLDDQVYKIETQPKTSILLYAVRKNPKTGKVENLVCRRLRQPYFGKVGRITGKVRFGEKLKEAAERELFEETGLNAKNVELEQVYHKIRFRERKKFIQDALFYCFLVTGFSGDLVEKTEYQENLWISKMQLKDGMDFYDDFVFVDRLKPRRLEFVESVLLAEGY